VAQPRCNSAACGRRQGGAAVAHLRPAAHVVWRQMDGWYDAGNASMEMRVRVCDAASPPPAMRLTIGFPPVSLPEDSLPGFLSIIVGFGVLLGLYAWALQKARAGKPISRATDDAEKRRVRALPRLVRSVPSLRNGIRGDGCSAPRPGHHCGAVHDFSRPACAVYSLQCRAETETPALQRPTPLASAHSHHLVS